jgi:hypothetical protein
VLWINELLAPDSLTKTAPAMPTSSTDDRLSLGRRAAVSAGLALFAAAAHNASGPCRRCRASLHPPGRSCFFPVEVLREEVITGQPFAIAQHVTSGSLPARAFATGLARSSPSASPDHLRPLYSSRPALRHTARGPSASPHATINA